MPRSVRFVGLRRAGKSTLAGAAMVLAAQRGLSATRIDVAPHIDIVPRICLGAADVLEEFAESGPVDISRLDRFSHFAFSRAPIRITHPRAEFPGDVANVERDLFELLRCLGEAARARGSGVVLVVDDFHRADRPGARALAAALTELQDLALPILVLMFGLPALPRLPWSPSRTNAVPTDVVEIGPVADAAVLRMLLDSLSGGDIVDAAVSRAVSWVSGYPARAAALAGALQGLPSLEIDVSQMNLAIKRATAELRQGVYEPAWEALNPKERTILRAVLTLPDPLNFSWTELVAASRVRGVSAQAVMPRLLEKELLRQNESYDQFGLAVPGWDEFLHDRFMTEDTLGEHYA